jgi:hypothetical protein
VCTYIIDFVDELLFPIAVDDGKLTIIEGTTLIGIPFDLLRAGNKFAPKRTEREKVGLLFIFKKLSLPGRRYEPLTARERSRASERIESWLNVSSRARTRG